MKSSILAAAILLTATGASAAPPAENGTNSASASTETEAEAEQADEKKICRTEKATGSLTRRTRVCMTAAQWREINSRTMRGVSEMQGQGSGGQQVNRDAERTAMGGF